MFALLSPAEFSEFDGENTLSADVFFSNKIFRPAKFRDWYGSGEDRVDDDMTVIVFL